MKVFDIFKKRKVILTPKKEKAEVKKEEAKKVKVYERKEFKGVQNILLKPLITEKASFLGQYNQYIFEIAKKANKIEVAKAFESVYKIKPASINIIKVKGKKVRYGRSSGRTKNWKKAIITLKPGEKIEVYEGVKEKI